MLKIFSPPNDMYKSSPEEIFSRIAEGSSATEWLGYTEWLRHEVETETLVEALASASTELMCTVLCDVLGWRREHLAVSQLITLLAHESSTVRSAAADALAKIGAPSAGTALLKRLKLPDPDIGVRRMLLVALGAVKCQEAIPWLIEYLQHPDPSQRGSASWSLGIMHVNKALPALQDALQRERSHYPKERMTEAIRAIQTVNSSK